MANEGIEGFTKHTDFKLNLNIFWKFFNNFDIKHREIGWTLNVLPELLI